MSIQFLAIKCLLTSLERWGCPLNIQLRAATCSRCESPNTPHTSGKIVDILGGSPWISMDLRSNQNQLKEWLKVKKWIEHTKDYRKWIDGFGWVWVGVGLGLVALPDSKSKHITHFITNHTTSIFSTNQPAKWKALLWLQQSFFLLKSFSTKSLASIWAQVRKQYFRSASLCHWEVSSPNRSNWNERALHSLPWIQLSAKNHEKSHSAVQTMCDSLLPSKPGRPFLPPTVCLT